MQKVLLLSALVASVLHVAAGSSCFRSELTFSQEGVCQGATRKLEMCVPPEGLAFYSDPGQLQSMTTQSESFIDKTECDSIATGICAMIGGELSAAPTVSTCGFNCGMAMGCDDAACAAATTDEARSSAVQCCDHADIAALLKTVADGACVGGSSEGYDWLATAKLRFECQSCEFVTNTVVDTVVATPDVETCHDVETLRATEGKVSAFLPGVHGWCSKLIMPDWHYGANVTEMRDTETPAAVQTLSHAVTDPGHAALRSLSRKTITRKAARRSMLMTPKVTTVAGSMPRAEVRSNHDTSQAPSPIGSIMREDVVCSGVLVHPRWVLTSAACLPVCMGMEDCQADVFLGGEHFDVVETRVDPRALMENKEAMVLAKLSGPSSAMPLELYDGGDIGTNDCTGLSITQLSASPPGWNATSNASMPGTSMVMSNVSQVLSSAQCAGFFATPQGSMYDHASMLCVQDPTYQSGCNAMVGAALVARTHGTNKDMLIGIGAFGEGCMAGVPAKPAMYARVSSAVQWMRGTVRELGVHPARKIVLTVSRFEIPPEMEGRARVHIYRGASMTEVPAEELVTGCVDGTTVDDAGTGALLVTMSVNGTAMSSSPANLPRFEAEYKTVGCSENFKNSFMPGEYIVPAACDVPDKGGIVGCKYVAEDVVGSGVSDCVDPMCKLDLSWSDITTMQKQGKAFTGGLGHLAKNSAAGKYGVWVCVRDWDPMAQRMCGVSAKELACFYFEEAERTWDYQGSNHVRRLVSVEREEQGRNTEKGNIDGKTVMTVFQ